MRCKPSVSPRALATIWFASRAMLSSRRKMPALPSPFAMPSTMSAKLRVVRPRSAMIGRMMLRASSISAPTVSVGARSVVASITAKSQSSGAPVPRLTSM